MLLKYEQYKVYLDKVGALSTATAKSRSGYLNDLINQVVSVLNDATTLHVPSSQLGLLEEYTELLVGHMSNSVDVNNLATVHYTFAELLRKITIFGTGSFNEHPVVKFYTEYPQRHHEIPRERIDAMLFSIPAEIARQSIFEPIARMDKQAAVLDAWEGSLTEWNRRVEDSEKRYKAVLQSNNYLGLAHAFSEMIKVKKEESTDIRAVMIGLGAAALIVPLLQVFLGKIPTVLSELGVSLVSTAVFSIAVEVILIYYFRIAHHRWAVIKSQIAQLELRHAMCAFVQDYAEKSKDLERSTLAKFENMIFADVMQDSSTPPSVYEAVESIAKVLAAWKRPA